MRLDHHLGGDVFFRFEMVVFARLGHAGAVSPIARGRQDETFACQ